MYGLTFSLPCVESEVGLDSTHGSLLTQDIYSVILKRAEVQALLTIWVYKTKDATSPLLKHQSRAQEPWAQLLASNSHHEKFFSPGVKFLYDPKGHLRFVKRYYKDSKYFKVMVILQRSPFSCIKSVISHV